MNFQRIITMQKKLDASYVQAGFTSQSKIDQKRILAILVEISEFANEYAPFKYWKRNIKINKEKVLEEFVDGIHFFATFIYKFNFNSYKIHSIIKSQDQSEQLLHTIKSTIKLFDNLNKENLVEAFGLYLGNARLLNITNQEIEDFYIKKNQINYDRIKNGY